MATTAANSRIAAARAFVRSLNILLKFARMYEFGHPRTAKQYGTAWSELRAALGSDNNEAGLLLAVSGDQLLIDGTPLESGAAEKSFARMLSTAGIASIHFSPKVTQASVARLVKGFPTGAGSKPAQLAAQLKVALADDPHIHVNEVCFVPADSAVAKTTIAAQLAARALGMNSEQTGELLNDPGKLLQLIVAAEGTQGHGGGNGNSFAASGRTGAGSEAQAGSEKRASGGGGEATRITGNVEGPVSVVPATTGGAENNSGTWNIVGGNGTGVSVDPNAGGFWLHKGDGSESRHVSGPRTEALRAGNGPASSTGPVTSVLAGDAGYRGDGSHGGSRSGWVEASIGMRGGRPKASGHRSTVIETGMMTLDEDELHGILHTLAQIARAGDSSKDKLDSRSFQSRLSALPRRARFTIGQALSALAAQAPAEDSSEKPALLQLAEHIAVRFALDRYERGDVQVNAVREMLADMSQELEALRKILGVYEATLTRAGIQVKSHSELLAQEFWMRVPEEKKKAALESKDAWCVPPLQTREFVEGMLARGEKEASEKILRNYASFLASEATETRRQTAIGLAELAPAFAKCDERLLVDTIRQVGVQIAEESDSELQSVASAAFVRLSQEAAKKRAYPAIRRTIEMVDYVEAERPGVGKSLRPRIAMEDRLPEFIEEALHAGGVVQGLKDVLRRLPRPAAEDIASRFSRAGFREDCEMLVTMMQILGDEGLEHLRMQLRRGGPNEAIEVVGILTRLDIESVRRMMPERVKEWRRIAHDRLVRQVASSGAPERGQLLLDIVDSIDPLIRPLAIGEIGISGEPSAAMRLLRMAEGDLPGDATDYLRLQAVEALGRLRAPGAEAVLRKIAEARRAWRWAEPAELRLVAAQAMTRIDPEWVRHFLPHSGLSAAEFSIEALDSDPNASAIRQRHYARLRLGDAVPATTTNLRENCRVEVSELALGGGVAASDHILHPGSVIELRLAGPEKSVKAQAIIRDARSHGRAFEVTDIGFDERSKLRRLLVRLGTVPKQSSPDQRIRRGGLPPVQTVGA